MGQIIHKPKRWTPLNIEKNPLNLPKVVIPPLHFLNPLFVVIQLWKKKKKQSNPTNTFSEIQNIGLQLKSNLHLITELKHFIPKI